MVTKTEPFLGNVKEVRPSVPPVAPPSGPSKDPQGSRDGDTYTPGPTGPRDVGLYKDKPPSIMTRIKDEEKALDTQVGGSHYKDFEIQPIEFIMKNHLNFCQGNVIKYICRYPEKNGIEDLKKAQHYINLLIQMEYGDVKN